MTRKETYQAKEDKRQLYDVCVGHRVEAPKQRVDDSYCSRDPNANSVGQAQDHTHCCTFKQQTCSCHLKMNCIWITAFAILCTCTFYLM